MLIPEWVGEQTIVLTVIGACFGYLTLGVYALLWWLRNK